MKKVKTERESTGGFNSVFIVCLKYLMTYMITKRSKGYVPYLYTRINYTSINVYINNKTGGVD